MDSSLSSSSSVPVHAHAQGRCPYADKEGASPHTFCPPQPGDYRAPCPALNTMANHGYLPRDGKRLTADVIIKAMKECYALSNTLAWFLTHGALFLLGQSTGGGKQLCLHDLARHNGVEHNASLYHPDADGEPYAPLHGDPALLAQLFADSKDGRVMAPLDVARARARRQAIYTKGQTLDFIHAELARGEIAIVLNCFNNPNPALHAKGVPLMDVSPSVLALLPRFVKRLLGKKPNPETAPIEGVPNEVLRYWFEHERLPEGWKPYHKTTLRQTISTVNVLRSGMRKFAKDYVQGAPASASVQEKAGVEAVKVLEGEVSESPISTEGEEHREKADGAQTLLADRPGSTTSSNFTLPTPKASEFTEPSKDPTYAHVRIPVNVMHPKDGVGSDMKPSGVVQIDGLPGIAEDYPIAGSWLQTNL